MDPEGQTGQPRPGFGRSILVVGATWLSLTALAISLSPQLALAAGGLPVGLALRAAWRARGQETWAAPETRLRRRMGSAAMLLAGGLAVATAWSIREAVPPWSIGLQAGALLHYWLLTLADL